MLSIRYLATLDNEELPVFQLRQLICVKVPRWNVNITTVTPERCQHPPLYLAIYWISSAFLARRCLVFQVGVETKASAKYIMISMWLPAHMTLVIWLIGYGRIFISYLHFVRLVNDHFRSGRKVSSMACRSWSVQWLYVFMVFWIGFSGPGTISGLLYKCKSNCFYLSKNTCLRNYFMHLSPNPLDLRYLDFLLCITAKCKNFYYRCCFNG